MADKQYLPNPDCTTCGGTGSYEQWTETTGGNWFVVDTSCGCRDWR
ncbi:hypothetical protein [Lentzea guizhouensis]|nr:hypothetical protein [Lentzea guizhouensis]